MGENRGFNLGTWSTFLGRRRNYCFKFVMAKFFKQLNEFDINEYSLAKFSICQHFFLFFFYFDLMPFLISYFYVNGKSLESLDLSILFHFSYCFTLKLEPESLQVNFFYSMFLWRFRRE